MDRSPGTDAAQNAERSAFYERIGRLGLTPLWEVLGALVPPQPKSPVAPVHFRYDAIRPHVIEAGRLISAEEAERRVLVLENPALRGQSCITQSLYAGLQLILPGEVAPAHRHTQSALRLVLDGEGAYTAVDGERTTMRYGDFIITPSWTFHDHGNDGGDPVVWLDGLDIPLVRFLDAGFAEKSALTSRADARPEGDALHRYGSNMLPLDHAPLAHEPARVFVYPFARTREALLGLARAAADPHFGVKQRFVNPATGRSPMPTIGTFAQRLAKGFATRPYRSSDSTVCVCLEGGGRATIGNAGEAASAFDFAPRDVFVVPSWHAFTLAASDDTILFSFSDRPVQEVLGLWREEKMA
ncbi:MAG TPA: gentisate 1,2-dioxygenase [Caldimonas sp.]|jgi:gentisate 1,2-dioxygenase|nr:gentisate 1,2-dioxygenase [Caldimonas sp.]HEV7578470.1 gentisate 1,2-dioxygenase [Caldimonas sp.]